MRVNSTWFIVALAGCAGPEGTPNEQQIPTGSSVPESSGTASQASDGMTGGDPSASDTAATPSTAPANFAGAPGTGGAGTNSAPSASTTADPDVEGSASGGVTGGAGGVAAGGADGAFPSGGLGGSSTAGNGNGGNTMAGTHSGGSAAGGSGGAAGGPASRPQRVLLYSFSTLEIPSVPAQLAILRQKLEGWQFGVDESTDPAVFSNDNLENYAAVGMINTCFSPFGQNRSGDGPEAQALQAFLQAGGGLFGTHCADVAFQGVNPPALYSELIGGRASSSNFEGTSDCRTTGEHSTVAQLPDTFEYTGNLDGTDFIALDTTVLVNCTWGDPNGTDVAVSWVRNEGTGRVFFTNFGKVDGDLTNATIGENHIIAGLAWVVGRE